MVKAFVVHKAIPLPLPFDLPLIRGPRVAFAPEESEERFAGRDLCQNGYGRGFVCAGGFLISLMGVRMLK